MFLVYSELSLFKIDYCLFQYLYFSTYLSIGLERGRDMENSRRNNYCPCSFLTHLDAFFCKLSYKLDKVLTIKKNKSYGR